MSVFISYKTEDHALYTSLCGLLDAHGVPRWSVSALRPGLGLADQLRAAIDSCDVCIFIATTRSLDASWCMAELGAFWGSGKRVITYMADPSVSAETLPPQLKEYYWTNDAVKVVDAAREHLDAALADLQPISGGMVYILWVLDQQGGAILQDIVSKWKAFNKLQVQRDEGYKAAKYACQCLEAFGMLLHFGGDEYMITDRGKRFVKSAQSNPQYARAFADFQSADEAQ